MADNYVAYGEITISDLIDSATYIYYAEDSQGNGANRYPSNNTEYIGFYNGPALKGGQPEKPSLENLIQWSNDGYWSGWLKYKGETGSGYYQIITTSNTNLKMSEWEQLFEISETNFSRWSFDAGSQTDTLVRIGDTGYIVGSISDRENISCTLIGTIVDKIYNDNGDGQVVLKTTSHSLDGRDGKDASVYEIICSSDQILKFFVKNSEEKINVEFSPDVLTIQLYKNTGNERELVDYSNYSINLSIAQTEFFKEIENGSISFNTGMVFEGKPTNFEEYIRNSLTEVATLLITVKQNEKVIVTKPILLSYGTSEDAAKLSLCANGIYMAMSNAGLVFNENGLTLTNGGFKIQEKTDDVITPLFYYDIDDKKLVMKGHIEATSGSIGGITLDDSRIFASGENGSFSINKNGSIEASNLTLTEMAYVDGTIQINDNCYIKSPSEEDGKIIVVNQDLTNIELFSVDNKGLVSLANGTITLDGSSAIMRGGLGGVDSWSITPTQAYFQNATIKGTLKTAVFEKGEIQTVGGAILIRPSALIKKCYSPEGYSDIYYLELENEMPTNIIGGYCQIGQGAEKTIYRIMRGYDYIDDNEQASSDSYGGLIIQKTSETEKTEQEILDLIEDQEISTWPLNIEAGFQNELLIYWGKDNENNITIGLNSNESDGELKKNAITIYKNVFRDGDNGEKVRSREYKIVLGEMEKNDQDLLHNLEGYGLYADNVYLKGQFIAEKTGTNSYYSGIHTFSSIEMPSGLFENPGDILFWAGAKDSSKNEIQAAPFKVDVNGNIYASSGYFTGSVISEATIEAARIKTAILEGAEVSDPNESKTALTIRGSKAIKFYDEPLSIGEELQPDGKTLYMELDSNSLDLHIPLEIRQGIDLIEGNITNNLRGNKMSLNSNFDFDRMMTLDVESVATFSHEDFIFEASVFMGKKDKGLEYRPVFNEEEIIGYDLYVK